MKATIYTHKIPIGTAILQIGDESMGCVYGSFEQNEAYLEHAQKLIWNFWKNSDLEHLRALRLNVQLENGYFLHPIGGITIDDNEELPNEPLRIDIAGLERHVLEEYFHAENKSPFVTESWHSLSIEEKIDLETELHKELFNNTAEKSFFDKFKFKAVHPLIEYSFSALARDERNDDVLFVCHKPGSDIGFAIVNLTWKSQVDRHSNYPITQFFKEFIDFKLEAMRREEWGWDI